MTVRNPYVVWLTGCGVYVLAVLHRSSLGVAGPDAIARLGINSAQLGAFVMLQLGIYAVMQIPAGILIDRWGARRMLLVATLTLGVAQVTFAFATTFPVALAARSVLGVGDALVFLAALRLAATWFPRHRYPVMAMWTGMFGMLGNLAATVPLALALAEFGWVATFAVTGALSLGYAVLLLRPAIAAPYASARGGPPASEPGGGPGRARRLAATIAQAWRGREHGRGTQVGFWVHQAMGTSPIVLTLVWGYPYLTEGLGLGGELAASLISVLVLGNVAWALVIGPFTGRRPGSRVPLAIVLGVLFVLAWAVLLAWPGGRPPVWVIVVVFLVLSAGGPGSQIAFQLARDYNPEPRLSTATGVVNAGGFVGGMICALSIGLILDHLSGDASPDLSDYRWALALVALVTLVATVMTAASTLALRRTLFAHAAAGRRLRVPVRPHWWDRIAPATEVADPETAGPEGEHR